MKVNTSPKKKKVNTSQIIENFLCSQRERRNYRDINNKDFFPGWVLISGELVSGDVPCYSLLGAYSFYEPGIVVRGSHMPRWESL